MSYAQTDQIPYHKVSNEPSECNMRTSHPFSKAAPPAHYLTLVKIKDIDTNDRSADAGSKSHNLSTVWPSPADKL